MDSSAASRSGSFVRFIGFLLVIALIGLVIFLDARRRMAEQQLKDLSVRYEQQAGSPAQRKEVAQEITERVRKLYKIPTGTEPTVATIVDVAQLRQRNAFYAKAKNGDHLIVTADRAILYDPLENVIIDVVPVQIQPPAQSSSSVQQVGKSTSSASVTSSAVSSKTSSSHSSSKTSSSKK